jgi:hypothetical protein
MMIGQPEQWSGPAQMIVRWHYREELDSPSRRTVSVSDQVKDELALVTHVVTVNS